MSKRLGPLADRLEQILDWQLGQGAAPDAGLRNVVDHQNEGHRRFVGFSDAGQTVERTGPARHLRNPRLSGQARIAVRHEHRRTFVTAQNVARRALRRSESLIERDIGIARDAEDDVDAISGQHAHERGCTVHFQMLLVLSCYSGA